MTRVVRGLLALLVLVVILIGAPWLLWQLAQLPGFLPQGLRLSTLLTTPDDGRLVLVLVWAVGWVLWAGMGVLILVEAAAALRGIRAPRLPAASLPQGWARALVIAAMALFIATPTPPALATGGPPQPDPSAATTSALVSTERAPSAELGGAGLPAVGSTETMVTVERGDTLWDLAEEHLEDPLRWPELYEHNKDIPQPDGGCLEDPNLIRVGWSLDLPRTEPAEAPDDTSGEALGSVPSGADDTVPSPRAAAPDHAPAEEAQAIEDVPRVEELPAPAPAAPAPSRPAEPAPAPTTAAAEAEVGGEVEDLEEEVLVPQWWHVAGLLGSGVVLGAGVAAVLAGRRREQFRARRPGRSIAESPAVVAPIERTAQLAHGLAARQVARLDQVLRRLGPSDWPSVEAVAMARDGTIVLRTLEPLRAPWEQSQDGWVLANHVPLDGVGEPVADQVCPYPLLVSIGTDARDRVWLANLTAIGILQIAGDQVMRADFLRYLAAELAVNPWSADVRVACAGIATDVVAMAPQRLDATVPEVTAIARRNAARAAGLATDALQGRAGQLGDEAWSAAAVLADPDLERIDELASLIVARPRNTGTALVTIGHQGALTVTATGRVRGFGLDLTAVGLTEDEAAGCAALLAAAEAEQHPEPRAADALVDVTGNLRTEYREDRSNCEPATIEPVLPAADDEYLAAAVVAEEDLADLAPRVPARVALTLQERDPDLDQQVDWWFAERCLVPRVALLGPVTARGLGRAIKGQQGYYVEVLAYLALHPNGVTSEEFAEAFSITVQRARTVISNCRQWVGYRPGTGTPFLPDARATAQAKARGIGIYLVEDCLVDVELFRRLRSRGIARGRAGIEDLERALELVGGRPFDQLRPGGWNWLFEGDRLDQHMVCAIGDIAHLVSTHHRQQGNLERARHATQIGLLGDPNSETLRLDLAGIMIEEGHEDAARRVLADALGDTVELDLTARAEGILRAKGWLEVG